MSFRVELEHLINKHSKENGSDTPDFILADYLVDCIGVFDKTIQVREKWYGREKQEITKITDNRKEKSTQ